MASHKSKADTRKCHCCVAWQRNGRARLRKSLGMRAKTC